MQENNKACCERCGNTVQSLVLCYNTQKSKQQSWLCRGCVKIVIRDNTAWQVKPQQGENDESHR